MTGARRPENAKTHRTIAPKNRISLKDVERHARLTEATDYLDQLPKTYCREKPQVSRSFLI
jgi:hypothetical protein